jgi:hypothetical protein
VVRKFIFIRHSVVKSGLLRFGGEIIFIRLSGVKRGNVKRGVAGCCRVLSGKE